MFFPHNDIADVFQATSQGYAKPLFGEDLANPINIPLQRLSGKDKKETWLQKISHSSAIYSIVRVAVRKYFAMPHSVDGRSILYTSEQMHRAVSFIKQIQIEFPVKQFFVYYIPSYDEISEKTLSTNVMRFQESCVELNLQCFSMLDIIHNIETPLEYYLREDRHFSKKGASAVADHLYQICTSSTFQTN